MPLATVNEENKYTSRNFKLNGVSLRCNKKHQIRKASHELYCDLQSSGRVSTLWTFTLTVVPARPRSFCAAVSLLIPSTLSPEYPKHRWSQFIDNGDTINLDVTVYYVEYYKLQEPRETLINQEIDSLLHRFSSNFSKQTSHILDWTGLG